MRMTVKGQITLPRHVRDGLGLSTESKIEFIEDDGKFYLINVDDPNVKRRFTKIFTELRGTTSVKTSADEIMNLVRNGRGISF